MFSCALYSFPLHWTLRPTRQHTAHVHNLTRLAQGALYQSGRRFSLASEDVKRQAPLLMDATLSPPHTTNLAMVQVVLGPDEWVDVAFASGLEEGEGKGKGKDPGADLALQARVAALSGTSLDASLKEHHARFDARFAKAFPPGGAGKGKGEGGGEGGGEGEGEGEGGGAEGGDRSTGEVAKRALSNLIGSAGYFAGQSLIATPATGAGSGVGGGEEEVRRAPPRALLTAVPSRSFFPRGFLWDEGFHQLVIRAWDSAMGHEMIATWLDLMDAEGWIPREAILGEEALARVPAEFVVQRTTHANPPSMLIALHRMAINAPTSPSDAAFLSLAYPRLRTWFAWFERTQAGPVPTSFRWRGRMQADAGELNPKTLTSGLDDYPRASHPSHEERHLDLRCWMALGAKAMAAIAEVAGRGEDALEYRAMASRLSDEATLNALHLDRDRGLYFDWGNHTDDVALVHRQVDAQGTRQWRRKVGRAPTPRFVREFGYVSLFPLMMRLLDPTTDNFKHQLDALEDDALLWTPFGLRSLATDSAFYDARNTEHDKPYWRAPIWINVNYLVLDALKHYAGEGGPHSAQAGRLFYALKGNVMGNVVRQYERTGYLWENYDDKTGVGTGSHPFTGWTALVVLIAAMEV